MNERPKNNKEETRSSWEGTPFAKMMQKMMNRQGKGLGFDCAEIMQKMRDEERGCCSFDCSEIMSQMMPMCCQPQDEKEKTRKEAKEAQNANQ